MTKPTGRPRGRPKTKEYATLMARIPQEMVDQVKRYAQLHRQPISLVIREGLLLLLENDSSTDFLYDRKEAHTENHIMSDTKEAGREPVPEILSDTNRVKVSDTKSATDIVSAFDASKYSLGKLCPRGHEHGSTGQSLLRLGNRHCPACDREKFHEKKYGERRQTKRQEQRKGGDA